jgi:phosphoserine aminotransferase
MKKHNFNPGPSILPDFTLEKTAEALKNFSGTGLSLLEVSHRGKEFQAVVDETVALFKELLNIPEGYSVIFLGGGASLQFAMVPYNMLETKAAYLNTGEWATKAIKEAKLFGEVNVVASSEDKTFNYIPRGFEVPKDVDYFHVTSNNTIYGTE